MTRRFVTYMPFWRPEKTRRRLLVTNDMQNIWHRVLASMFSIPVSLVEEYHPEIGIFLMAYARDGGKYAFQHSEEEWQFRFAIRHLDVLRHYLCIKRFSPPGLRSNPTIQDYTQMNLRPIGMQPKSRMFRLKWFAVEIDMNVESVFTILHYFDSTKDDYRRRWRDPKFAFATEETAPVPRSVLDVMNADDLALGLGIESLFRLLGPQLRYDCKSIRSLDLRGFISPRWELYNMQQLLLLNRKLRQMFTHDTRDEFKRLQQLAEEAAAATPDHVWQRDTFIRHKVPATVIAQLDALLQEVSDEALSTRQ